MNGNLDSKKKINLRVRGEWRVRIMIGDWILKPSSSFKQHNNKK